MLIRCAVWCFLIIAGSLFLSSGMPAESTQEVNQHPPNVESTFGHISEPSRVASLPASVWFDARVPSYAKGYFARLSEGDFPAELLVYDRNGKLASDARVSIPGGTELWLVGATPTKEGGAIASGEVRIDDKTTYFLAQTSVSGGVVSMVRTETFVATRMCQANDGTVWTLGRDPEKEGNHETEYALVRQYSFEKGLLHSYLSRSLVDFRVEGVMGGGEGPAGTFLACGEDRVSGFLNETNEYFEIDPSKESLKRWRMAKAPFAQARVTGLAVTDKGRVYASCLD
jgi:hypothetical protein